jgi:hypothetical protein
MVTAIPFLWLRDGTHPLAAGICETPASCPGRADQAGTAGGCQKNLGPGRQIDSQDSPDGRQPIRRPGRDPGPRPYAPAQSRSGKPGRKHYPHSPCRFGTVDFRVFPVQFRAQIDQLCTVLADESKG